MCLCKILLYISSEIIGKFYSDHLKNGTKIEPETTLKSYAVASEPKRVNFKLNIIGVNSFRLGGLHSIHI